MQKSLMATVILKKAEYRAKFYIFLHSGCNYAIKKSAGTAKIVLFKNENGGRAGAY